MTCSNQTVPSPSHALATLLFQCGTSRSHMHVSFVHCHAPATPFTSSVVQPHVSVPDLAECTPTEAVDCEEGSYCAPGPLGYTCGQLCFMHGPLECVCVAKGHGPRRSWRHHPWFVGCRMYCRPSPMWVSSLPEEQESPPAETDLHRYSPATCPTPHHAASS